VTYYLDSNVCVEFLRGTSPRLRTTLLSHPPSEIRQNLEEQGRVIGPHDLLIAAIVHAGGGVLVTHNASGFARVQGLRVEDWQ